MGWDTPLNVSVSTATPNVNKYEIFDRSIIRRATGYGQIRIRTCEALAIATTTISRTLHRIAFGEVNSSYA